MDEQWTEFTDLAKQFSNLFTEATNNINCPKQLTRYLMKRSQRNCRSFRDQTLLDQMWTSFKFLAASAWNKLPREIRELTTLAQFKGKTFAYLINMDSANHTCTI